MAPDVFKEDDEVDGIRRALEVGQEDDDYWRIVLELRRGGEAQVFERAAGLARSDEPAERILGVDIINQFGEASSKGRFAEESLNILLALSVTESDPDILRGTLAALSWLQDQRAVAALLSHLDHPIVAIRLSVAMCLPTSVGDIAEGIEKASVVSALEELMTDSDEAVRDWATFGLGQLDIDTQDTRDALLARASDIDDVTAGEAVRALASRGDSRAIPFVSALLRRTALSQDWIAIDLAAEAAAGFRDSTLLPHLLEVHRTRDLSSSYLGWIDDAIDACGSDLFIAHVEAFIGHEIEVVVREADDEWIVDLVRGPAVIHWSYGGGPTGALAVLAAGQRWLVEQLGSGAAPGETYVEKARNALDEFDLSDR